MRDSAKDVVSCAIVSASHRVLRQTLEQRSIADDIYAACQEGSVRFPARIVNSNGMYALLGEVDLK